MNDVAVLFARRDSVYKTIPGVDVWDIDRNALLWHGGCPCIAHPPCRAWGKLRHLAKPVLGEKELALWAVEQVRRNGGVLEHPKMSTLWAAAELPRPGEGFDSIGGWTLGISQNWFGHRAEKITLLYIVGLSPCETPDIVPVSWGRGTHLIGGQRPRKGDRNWRPECTATEREHTPRLLAEWLVELARGIGRNRSPSKLVSEQLDAAF